MAYTTIDKPTDYFETLTWTGNGNTPRTISGLDFVTSISGAASSISNVGPGLGEIIGPDGNYKSLPDLSKWILASGMLLGRLELFAVLVLFFPSFWRN